MPKDPYDMSDEELEAAFHAAKDELDEPQEDVQEEEPVEEEVIEEDYEEDEDEDLEQPDEDEDSDDDAGSDNDVDDEADEDSEEDEVGPDGEDEESTDEEPEDVEEEAKEEEQRTQIHKFKANGREYEFTDDEMRANYGKLFGQAMDYTKKMQYIKPRRQTLDALDEAGLTHQDVSLMIDVFKGDKTAISEVMKRQGIDSIDTELDELGQYEPKDYGRDERTLDLNDVIDSIKGDPEYATTHQILESGWDDASWRELSSKPEWVRLLHEDVKSGMYDKLMPTVEKLKLYDGGTKSDIEYYGQAASLYGQEQQQNNEALRLADEQAKATEAAQAEKARVNAVRREEAKAKAVTKERAKRKAATQPKKAPAASKVTNYLDDDDDAFNEWYSKLEGI